MTSKQAQRSKQKKAVKRKKVIAARTQSYGEDLGAVPSLTLDLDFEGDLPEFEDTDYLPNGMIKASAALLALGRPMLADPEINTRDAVQRLFTLIMISWNMDVMDAMGRDADGVLQGLLKVVPEDSREEATSLIAHIGSQKRALFPDDLRLFMSVEVIEGDGKWQINVTSATSVSKT
jgi:hypothetical protein